MDKEEFDKYYDERKRELENEWDRIIKYARQWDKNAKLVLIAATFAFLSALTTIASNWIF